MKKRMLAIMMSALVAAGICSGVTVYADADSKTLTVGFDAEYPPFGYMDESGEYVGFDLDVAQKVCDNLGWELVKKPINWDSKDMELNSGNIDCIWNGFTINGREDDYTWSDPYLNNEQVMVVTSDSGIETLADLAGKNVVVQAASAALDALNSEDNKELTDSFASLTENPDYNTAFMNIDSGAADAVAVDIGVAKYQLAQREEGKYKILDEPIQSEQYGIGFAKGNEELRDTVWAEVMKLYDEGEIDKLAEQYGVVDMLCLGDEEAADKTEESTDAAEENVKGLRKKICFRRCCFQNMQDSSHRSVYNHRKTNSKRSEYHGYSGTTPGGADHAASADGGSSPPAPEPGGRGGSAGDGGLCQGAADGDGIPSAGVGRRPDRHRHRN